MADQESAYAELSRSQRIAYWRSRFEAVAAGLEPVPLRERALIDLWRRLSRLEPSSSVVPASVVCLYFDLREALVEREAKRLERLSLAPCPPDGEAEGVRVPPSCLDMGEERIASLECELSVIADESIQEGPQSPADLVRWIELGYLNTYGPSGDPATRSLSEPGRDMDDVSRRYWLAVTGRSGEGSDEDPVAAPAQDRAVLWLRYWLRRAVGGDQDQG